MGYTLPRHPYTLLPESLFSMELLNLRWILRIVFLSTVNITLYRSPPSEVYYPIPGIYRSTPSGVMLTLYIPFVAPAVRSATHPLYRSPPSEVMPTPSQYRSTRQNGCELDIPQHTVRSETYPIILLVRAPVGICSRRVNPEHAVRSDANPIPKHTVRSDPNPVPEHTVRSDANPLQRNTRQKFL